MYQVTSLFVQNTQDNQAKEDEQKQLSIFSSRMKAKKQSLILHTASFNFWPKNVYI